MIKFFRRIRQHMLTENKFSKYLLYAIGEIVLVVIGILIALAINNWDNSNQKEKLLVDDYNSILEEITFINSKTEFMIKSVDSTIIKNQNSLKLLQSQNTDSIYQLENTLNGLVKLFSLKFDLPVTIRFIEDDISKKVRNEKLKKLLLKLKSQISFLEFYSNYATNQYQSLIEPYVVKNLNYAKIQNREEYIDVGQKINYETLSNDLELSNILNLKLETEIDLHRSLKELNKTLKSLKSEILNEMNKK